MKRIWCIALAAVMLFTMIPAQVTSEDGGNKQVVPGETTMLPRSTSAVTPPPASAPAEADISLLEFILEEAADAPVPKTAEAAAPAASDAPAATAPAPVEAAAAPAVSDAPAATAPAAVEAAAAPAASDTPAATAPAAVEAAAAPAASDTPAATAPAAVEAAAAPAASDAPAAPAPAAVEAAAAPAASDTPAAPANAEAVILVISVEAPAEPVSITVEAAAAPAASEEAPQAETPVQQSEEPAAEAAPQETVELEVEEITVDATPAETADQPEIIVEQPAARLALSASAQEALTQTPYTLRFSASGADEMALLEDGTEIFRTEGGAENSIDRSQEREAEIAYVLRARYGEEWEQSEAVRVRVTAPYGEIDAPSLDMPERVDSGETVTISIEEVEHADHYAMQVVDSGDQVVAQYSRSASGSVVIPGDALQQGEYRVEATVTGAGTTGEGTASRSFVVRAGEHQVTLAADKTELLPGENAVLTLSAPEADSAVLFRCPEGGAETQEAAWTGDIPATCAVTSAEAAVVSFRLDAHYGKDTVSSNTVKLTFASKKLDAPALSVKPSAVLQGDDVVISIGKVAHATTYTYELTTPSGSKTGASKNTTEGFNIRIRTKTEKDGAIKYLSAGLYRMKVTVSAEGYENESAEITFRVVKLALETGVTEVTAGQKFTLTVSAPSATAIELLRVEADGSKTVVDTWESGGSFNSEVTAQQQGKLTFTMLAKYGSEWLNGGTVTVTVNPAVEQTATLTVAPAELRVGGKYTLTAAAEKADAVELLLGAGESVQSVKKWESGGSYTVELEAGQEGVLTYTVRAKYGEEWFTGNSVTVTVNKALPTITLTASPETAETGKEVTVRAEVPDADSFILYADGEQAGSEADDPAWTFTYYQPGAHAYRLEALYGKDKLTAEAAVTITASKGKLAAPAASIDGIVDIADIPTLTFSATANAEGYWLDLYDASRKLLSSNEKTQAGSYPLTSAALEAGDYVAMLTAWATGYESAVTEKPFSVRKTAVLTASAESVTVGEPFTLTATAKAADALELLQTPEGGSAQAVKTWQAGGSYTYEVTPETAGTLTYTLRAKYADEWVQSSAVTVLVNKPEVIVGLTVSPETAETGAAVTVQAGEVDEADSYRLFVNDVQAGSEADGPEWAFTYYSAGEYAYRLEAVFGEETQTAEATLTVTAAKGKLDAPEVTVPASVALSENVRMSFTQAPNAEKYLLAVYNADGKLLARAEVAKAGAYRLGSGSALGEGVYRLVVTAQAAGYDAAIVEKSFTVAATVDQSVTLSASKTAVTTLESYTLSVESPNAEALEVRGVNADGENVYSYAWSAGGTQSVSVATAVAGKITYTARARFGETWNASEPVTVQVTATKGDLEASQLTCPYQVPSGQSVKLTCTAVTGAESYAVRIVNVVTGETAASAVLTKAGEWQSPILPDGHYRAEVTAQAAGYNAEISSASLHVGALDRTVAFTAASTSALTNTPFALTINAPHADELRLYVKAGSGADELYDAFDYKPEYSLVYPNAATLTLRLEGLIDNTWVKGNSLTVQVTAPNGQLAAPTIDAASQIKKGDKLIFTVSKAEKSTQQTVKMSKNDGTASTTIYSGVATAKTFKIDTSRLPEGQYVITVTALGPGYVSSTASANVYIGNPAAPTPTPTPKATATAKATATTKPTTKATATTKVTAKPTTKATATTKVTAKPTTKATATTKTTKKPSSGGSSVTKAPTSTPKSGISVITATPPFKVSPTPAPIGTVPPPVTTEEEDILYRNAVSGRETYGLDMQKEINAFDTLMQIVDFLTNSGSKVGISIAHAEELMADEETIMYLDLNAPSRLCYVLGLLGLTGPVDDFIAENPEWVNPEVRNMLISAQRRKAQMNNQERAAWNQMLSKYFGMSSTPSGDTLLYVELSIYNGSTVRLERLSFREGKDDWYLDQIEIGTMIDEI